MSQTFGRSSSISSSVIDACRSRRRGSFARGSSWGGLGRRRLASRNGGRVPRHVAGQVALQRSVEQRLMQAPRQVAGGEFRKGAREGRLTRHPTRRLPAAQAAQGRFRPQPLHQRPGGGHVQHRFRQKGPRQRGTILQRPAPPAPAVGQPLFHPHQFQHPDEPLVALDVVGTPLAGSQWPARERRTCSR